ncbi:hypothetical protein L1049_002316 [Liquidambar formosana]|uniref:Uncharacterized protein n=1 Tax=Liquidambar formosana TaxID=63359 RepID=A0AAP0R866_LIQFO
MAMTLLMRPYVVAARFFPLFQAAKPFISHSISFCKTPVGGSSYVGTKLQIHEGLSYYGYKLGGGRRFTTRATQVNDSGSIDSPLMQSMEKKIKEDLNAELVTVKDAYGDGRHVSIDVISSAFEGQSAVNRQRMVYKAIWEELQSTVHAVDQMTTRTPTEAAAEK